MSAQLQVRNNQTDDLVLQDIENTQRLCSSLMKTPHYAKMGDVGVFAVVQKARSIGMNPLDALNGGMYFVQGKCEISGQSMLALIRQHGHSVSMDPKSTQTHVRMFGRRADNGDTWTAEFSLEDAKKQGLVRNNRDGSAGMWEKMPKVMCMWRCVSQLGRFLFSDVLKGVYVQGEISDAPAFNSPINLDISTGELIEDKPKVTQEQVFEFEDILSECPDEVKKLTKEYLTKQGFNSYDQLPIKAFEVLRDRAIAKRDEYKASQKKEVKEDLFQVEVI